MSVSETDATALLGQIPSKPRIRSKPLRTAKSRVTNNTIASSPTRQHHRTCDTHSQIRPANSDVGRVNEAVVFAPSTDAIRGVLSAPATGVRFWAKVTAGTGVSVYALVGGSAAGTVTVSGDGQWAEYRLAFGSTRPAGQEMMLLVTATGAATVLLDDMGLTNPPPPPPPTTATTTPAPTGHYETVVTVDWRAGMHCLVFPDLDGYVVSTTCDFVTLSGTLPANIASGSYSAVSLADQAVLGAGAVADDPYNTYGTGTYTHSVSSQVWVPGPPTTTIPPAPLYPDWGVVLRQYGSIPAGNDTFGFETRFGNPPASVFQTFTTNYGAVQTVLNTGALGDNPPYGNTFTHYSTVAPVTTTPAPTTTTTVVVTTTTIPTKPTPFSGSS